MVSQILRSQARWGLLLAAVALCAAPLADRAAAQAHDEHGAAAAAGHGEEEHANTNPLSVDPDLAVFTAIIFVVLLIVLGKFAWGPITAALEKREHMVAEQIASAERINAEARRLLEDYEKKLTGAQDQVRALIEEGRRDAEVAKQNILAEAKAAALAERDRGVHEIEQATDRALKELSEASANMAVDLAGKIVHAKLNAADHQKLIQEAVTNLQKASPSRN